MQYLVNIPMMKNFSLRYYFSKRLFAETGIMPYISKFKTDIVWVNDPANYIRYNLAFLIPIHVGYNIVNNDQVLLSYNAGIEKNHGITFHSKIVRSTDKETISSWGNEGFFHDFYYSLISQYYYFSSEVDLSYKKILQKKICFSISYKADIFNHQLSSNKMFCFSIKYKFK